MHWRLIEYNSFPGNYNMNFDLNLVNNCPPTSPVLRIYGWEPYCISIGANQSFSEINQFYTQKHNIDIVKRPTGGRAILHANELTYSVVMPNNFQVSGKKLYEDISNAIIIGLKNYHSNLSSVELEKSNPNFSQLLNEPSGSLCFASAAKSEIKFKGKKLVGSAQRKMGSTILQHGSILIGQYHKKLIDYLNVDENDKNKLMVGLSESTTEIETIIEEKVNIIRLQDKIVSGFEELFEAKFFVEDLEIVS